MELTGKQKRALRALAHHLKPVVTIGKQGVAAGLLEQVEHNLLAAELVKVKVLKTCPQAIGQIAAALTGGTGARLAQTIGRTLVLYRPNPESPVIRLPS